MVLKLGHDIKVKVGVNKKNIRLPSTYLSDLEEEERQPEVVRGGHCWRCPPRPLIKSWPPHPLRLGCKKWIHSHINRGYIFG
jgi:hypothetical protein